MQAQFPAETSADQVPFMNRFDTFAGFIDTVWSQGVEYLSEGAHVGLHLIP